MAALVWFRRDLRLDDNPAWTAATKEHAVVRPVFVLEGALWTRASQLRRDVLGSNLAALDEALQERGGRLRVERGGSAEVLASLTDSTDTVYFNRDYTPFSVRRDREVVGKVARVSIHDGGVVHPPESILTDGGRPYRVFTPYWRRWETRHFDSVAEPRPVHVAGDTGVGIPDHRRVPGIGEEGAADRLARFLSVVDRYDDLRDVPAEDATSHLSMDLKFGTIGPRRVVTEVGDATTGRRSFIRQLAWRDFYAQVMWHRPDTVEEPYRPEYSAIEWVNDPAHIAAWKSGMTGYPLVDAGMRQLASDGFMHNRVRMVAASFLVKDLLVDWRIGERWFRHHLIDADVAQNVGNWQWVAGTGVDAAPYFRVFNPTAQSKRFDPDGVYIRRWVPELADVPSGVAHAPWVAAASNPDLTRRLVACGYPKPIVDHSEARERVLRVYAEAKDSPR